MNQVNEVSGRLKLKSFYKKPEWNNGIMEYIIDSFQPKAVPETVNIAISKLLRGLYALFFI